MEGGDETRKPGGHSGALTLFLSVYLLVLAFFILLDSMSSFEDVKSKAVMHSLSSTFTDTGTAGPSDPFVSNFGDAQTAREFQAVIAEVFQAAIPAARARVLEPGRLLQIDALVDELFLPDQPVVRPGQTALLDRIVAAISAPPAGWRYEVELTLPSLALAGGRLPIGETLQASRGGAFAREMLQRGAPPEVVTVGIESGDPLRLRILFRTMGEDEGRIDFGAGD